MILNVLPVKTNKSSTFEIYKEVAFDATQLCFKIKHWNSAGNSTNEHAGVNLRVGAWRNINQQGTPMLEISGHYFPVGELPTNYLVPCLNHHAVGHPPVSDIQGS